MTDVRHLRGVALTVDSTFGLSERSDLGPSAGIGFLDSWPDDLAALADAGADAIRLTFDWARLQPRPQTLAEEWSERYDQLVDAIRALDLPLWATALDEAVPRWFDNEGGTGDDETLDRWWPRWMERVAERWGDRIDGWLPFDALPSNAARAWRDTRGILSGGTAPVAVALTLDRLAALDLRTTLADRVIEADAIGISLTSTEDRWSDRLGESLREAADDSDLPILVARCSVKEPTADAAATVRTIVDGAIADGVPVHECFVTPAIASSGDHGLLDGARGPTEAGRIYLTPDA